MKFQATILVTGKTAAGIVVPPEVVEALGAGKRPPIRVTINGHTYRTSIAVMGGDFMFGVSAENRSAAAVAGGDEVDVEIEVDTEPRVVKVPPDFAVALTANAEAKRFFDGLSYSNRLRNVLAIESAKTAETRERRIAKTVEALASGKA